MVCPPADRRPVQSGVAVATILLTAIFIGPIAGVYLDRFNRRDVMLASNLVQAAVAGMIGVLYSLGSLNFPVLLVMLFVLNSGAHFVRPAVTAMVPGITEGGSVDCQQIILSKHVCQSGRGLWHRRYRSSRSGSCRPILLR